MVEQEGIGPDPRTMHLPSNVDAEKAVLGSILLDPEAVETALDHLTGEEFYRRPHQLIYAAMKELSEEGEPIDLVTLTTRLMGKGDLEGIGGVAYLAELSEATPTAANIKYYLDLVADVYIHRLAILETTKNLNAALKSDDSSRVLASLKRTVEALDEKAATNKKQNFHNIREVAMQVFESVEDATEATETGKVMGIPSGYEDLDKMTSGFQRTDLIIVAARPSVGKTAFALNVAENVAIRARDPVAIFSLEMSAKQLVQRMICAEGNIEGDRLKKGHLGGEDWNRITFAIGALSDAPIYIDDSNGLTVRDIRSKCRSLKKETGSIGLILVDYLQLLTTGKSRQNWQEQVAEISRDLKQLARELDTTVIALSQLSRGVEQRADKRPMMSDLRESGSIEQDADIVAFLYRDDYYNNETEKKNIIEIIISKQRNGPTGTVELAFLKQYGKFLNLARSHQEEMKI